MVTEASKLKKVSVDDLEIGMYVDSLDRPWTETKFMFQGFFITNDWAIDELKRLCKFVYVNPLREAEAPAAQLNPTPPSTGGYASSSAATVTRTPVVRERYPVALAVEKEIVKAKAIHEEAKAAAKAIFTQMLQNGRLDVELAEHAIKPMLDSMLRNPNAMIWLSRMKQHDSYIFNHSLNTSIWGMAFARHLQMSKDEIYEVGLGCMLFDVGKTQLPLTLLLKAGPLTPEELALARSHVSKSLTILRDMDGITPRVMDLVRNHHERFDGSGYPNGLKGNDIPTVGKLAGMVDTYDALVSFRPHAGERSSHEAIRYIYTLRGTLFQPEVVEQFMQVVGVFPTGSLIELNNGAVGVVIAQNPSRLRPRIALLLNDKKKRMPYAEVADLLYDNPWADAGKFWIDRCLQVGAYGIDPRELQL